MQTVRQTNNIESNLLNKSLTFFKSTINLLFTDNIKRKRASQQYGTL